MNKTVGSLLILAASVLTSSIGWSADLPQLPDRYVKSDKLRIGVKCDSPPSGYLSPDGKNIGIEIDLGRKLAEFGLGSAEKAVFVCLSSEARIPALLSDKVDLLVATLGVLPERAKVIDFSEPYMWGSSRILVVKDSKVSKIADLSNSQVLVRKGSTTQIEWLEKNVPGIQLTRLNSVSDMVQALRQGRASALAGDGTLLKTLSSGNPDMRVLDEEYDIGVNAVGMRKGEEDLALFVNAVIKKLKTDHYYEAVVGEYISDAAVLGETIKSYQEDPPVKN